MASANVPEIRSLFIPGPVGRLEAILNTGNDSATHTAVVCHPHPLYGGTMHNRVVFHAMKALNEMGMPVLRFNFRDTGLSAGEYDEGRGEIDDVKAALNWLEAEYRLPIIFAGFSFGAAVGLKATCLDDRVDTLISIGTPLRLEDENCDYSYSFLVNCSKPKLFVSGANDEYASREQLENLIKFVPDPKQLALVDDADHFFEGHLQELRQTIDSWVRENVAL